MDKKQLFAILSELDWQKREFAVFGGACLAAHEIRETEDLEVFVTDDLFTYLIGEGWEKQLTNSTQSEYVTKTIRGVAVLAFKRCGSKQWVPDVDSYISQPEVIDGMPFMPLEEMRAWKANTARSKDLADVQLIDDFLTAR